MENKGKNRYYKGSHISERKFRQIIKYFSMDITVFQTAQVSRQTINNNGFEFSYKALTQRKRTKKVHPFDKICIQNKIQYRTIKFRHPWTNGMM